MSTLFKRFFFIAVSAAFLSSCHEKGCTNAAAINYNVTADEDDGSCIVCTTTEQPYDYVEVDLTDDNWGSSHYNESVARFELTQNIENPSNSVCGEPTSSISLKVRSLINQKMYLHYWVRDYTGPINININGEVLLEPYAVVDEGKHVLDNTGIYIQIGLDSIQAVPQGNIIYY